MMCRSYRSHGVIGLAALSDCNGKKYLNSVNDVPSSKELDKANDEFDRDISDVFQCIDIYMYLLYVTFFIIAIILCMEISEFCEGNLQNTFLQLKELNLFCFIFQ